MDPIAQMVDEFRRATIAHPILRRVDAQARQAITAPDSKNLVIIYGPTGVGKTTLIQRVARVLDEELADELTDDVGRAPVPIISAIAPEAVSFRWKEFYLRTLRAIEHPFAAEQVRATGHRPDADELRTRVERALQVSRPRAVIIDEAHHIGVGGSSDLRIKQLEILKSHASASGTRFVLVGTYDLIQFRNLNGQLSRRSVDIHFPRYRPLPDELIAFRETVGQMGAKLPIDADFLSDAWEDVYERSAGCIGIVKDWLTQALALALQQGDKTLTPVHLARTAMTVAAMTSIAREIRDGEAAVQEDTEERRQLRFLLGLEAEPASAPIAHAAPSTRRRRPGERSPNRDQVLRPTNRKTADVA